MVSSPTKPLIQKTEQGIGLDAEDVTLLQQLLELEGTTGPQPEDRVVHKGDAALPAPMVMTKDEKKDYVTLRRVSDGKLVPLHKNWLPSYLKQRLPDGRKAWIPPSAPYTPLIAPGEEKCPFHPEHPDYITKYKAMGIPPCGANSGQPPKANFPSKEMAIVHAENKHERWWNRALEADKRAREQEEREERRAANTALVAALKGQQAPVVAPAAGATTTLTETPTNEPRSVATCADCGETFVATNLRAAKQKVTRHKKKAHTSAA